MESEALHVVYHKDVPRKFVYVADGIPDYDVGLRVSKSFEHLPCNNIMAFS